MANTLMDALKELYQTLPDMLLNDGATTWTVDNLMTAIRTNADPDAPELARRYVLGETADGRITISHLDDAGYRCSPADYTQETNDDA